MELKLIEKDKGQLKFTAKGVEITYLNLLRRYIANHVPIMAIEDVEFRKNSSILYDEIIAHRLGLTPLKTDIKSYNLPSECTCNGEGCAKCQVTMTLKAKGPGVITAENLVSKDPAIKPIYKDMPIVKLMKSQDIEFEATATLGQGLDHAKFNAALCHYHHASVEEGFAKYKNLPKGDFVFVVESYGQLAPNELVTAAVDRISLTIKDFTEKLKKPDAGVPESGQMGTVEVK